MSFRSFIWALLACATLGLENKTHAQSAIVPDQLILQLNPDQSPANVLADLQLSFPEQPLHLEPLAPALGLFRLDGNPTGDLQQWLEHVQQNTSVRIAQYNHTLQRRLIPSDPSFPLQWGMNNTGGLGLEGADIDAPEAWDVSTGGMTLHGDTLVIAVIDDGFDRNHEDLMFWTNRGEIAGDGLDNDGNGYIDDVQGWNGTDGNAILPVAPHGTHVCGIAAALGDNGTGVTGVNWNLPILPVYADLEEDDVVAAYGYVHAMRALYDASNGTQGAYVVVTNSSFGLDFAQPEDFPIWCAMYDSLGALGILSPAATINAFVNVDVVGDVPTGCASEFMIAVTNTDNDDELHSAGFGPLSIDLGAPGTGVYSTTPGDNYGYNSGTSMATPHVAGTIALLYSAACTRLLDAYEADPSAIALRMKDYLLQGVTIVADLSDRTLSGGRLNINQSLMAMLDDYCRPEGLNGVPQPETFRLFPVPASDVLYVEMASSVAQIGDHWMLYDGIGRVVRSGIWPTDAQQKLEISVEGLPAGYYVFADSHGRSARLIKE